MPQFNTYKRQYPRVEVLRGFDPNEPFTRTVAAPVKSGVTILSGQVISLLWNGTTLQYEWILGVDTGNNAGATPHIALSDSADYDVLEAGNLNGLSCAGQFEIETAFFKANDTYNIDVPLTYDGVTGNVKATTVAGDAAGAPILGFVTRNHGLKSLVGINSNCVHTDVISFNTKFVAGNGA